MNTLHDLIYITRKRGLYVDKSLSSLTPDQTLPIKNAVLSMASKAVCFDFGDSEMQFGFSDGEPPRLPFPTVWAEIDIFTVEEEKVRSGALFEETDKDLYALFFVRHKGSHWKLVSVAYTDWIDGKRKMFASPPREDGGHVRLPSIYFKAFEAIQCVNVERVEQKPLPMQARKARSRGVPIFSTWTLALKLSRKESQKLGGTHASPRVHLRRGHVREFAPGRTTWVQSCVVRGKGRGMIAKDYAVTTGLDAPLD
jgi:hypothetical protein